MLYLTSSLVPLDIGSFSHEKFPQLLWSQNELLLVGHAYSIRLIVVAAESLLGLLVNESLLLESLALEVKEECALLSLFSFELGGEACVSEH